MRVPLNEGEIRLRVGLYARPPYDGACAYVQDEEGRLGIRYWDGYTDWLGSDISKAFGDDPVTVHSQSLEK